MARPVQKAPIGEIFTRLTVIGDAEPHIRRCGRKSAMWAVKCICGKIFSVQANSLKRNLTKSCGCLNNELASELWKSNLTHGESNRKSLAQSPEYTAWKAMKQRCYDRKSAHFDNYGGRGITVCARWINSFDNFLLDMGRRPTQKHSIDRINNNDGYQPNNCKWSSKLEQSRNRASVILDLEKAEEIRALKKTNGWGKKKISQHLNLPLGCVVGALYGGSWKE